MSKVLIVAEKSSQAGEYKTALFWNARTWSGIVDGHNITVVSLVWHVLTFKQPKEVLTWVGNLWSLDAIPFQLKDVPFKAGEWKAWIIAEMKKHFSDNYDFIINATDPDREWSFLFYELYDYLKCKLPVKRFYPTDITHTYLRNNILKNFEDSAYDRRIGDAWYGRSYMDYQFWNNNTVLFTKKVGEFVKVWRVKLWILAIIKKREQDIKDFGESRLYYLVEGNFEKSADTFYAGILQTQQRMYDKKEFDILMNQINSLKWTEFKISSLKKDAKSNAAPIPYTLVSLWKDTYTYFWWDWDKTLKMLQTLYEAKLSTYPRTKIPFLPETYRDSVKYNFASISSHYWLNYQYVDAWKRVFDTSKVKEHSGIVPLLEKGWEKQLSNLSPDQKKLYELLVARFFQIFAEPELYDSYIVVTSKDKFDFKTQVKEVTNPGWTKIKEEMISKFQLKKSKKADDDEDEEKKNYKNIWNLKLWDPVILKSTNEKQWKEVPPPLFNDWTLTEACSNPKASLPDNEKNAALVKFMPEAWIGTVATLWTIITEMVENELIQKIKDRFYVTDKWNQLWDKLPENYRSILFTAQMEEQLDKIAHWSVTIKDFLDDIYNQIQKDINLNKNSIVANKWGSASGWWAEDLNMECPDCKKGKLLKVLSKKTNKYYAVCSLSKRSWNGTCEYINEWDDDKKELVSSTWGWFGGKDSGLNCPNCSKSLKDNDRTVFCDCGFTLWKTVSSKKLTDKIIKELISDWKTKDKVKWLKSKAGKDFDATLILDKKTGKVQFMF